MKKLTVLVLCLFLFSSLVSASTFADFLSGNLFNLVTGESVKNNAPKVTLNSPSDNQVVEGKKVKFDWRYFDADGDEQQNYLLQIDDDYRFYTPLNYFGLKETVDYVNIPSGDGTYFWRVQSKDAYGWGKWSETRRFILDSTDKVCVDGTSFWKCSDERPMYCDGGTLIESCQKCGCDINGVCEGSGTCTYKTCPDGTFYGACAVDNSPKYCQMGVLINVCSFCGCPEGQECTGTGQCANTLIKINPVDNVKISFFSRIAWFFKSLLGVN